MEFFANQYDCHINLFFILTYFNVDELRKIFIQDTMPGLVMEQELNCSTFMYLSLS